MYLKDILLKYIKENKDPFPSIIGQKKTKRQLLSSLIAGRNVIIVGPPGTGKTTLAKDIARLLPSIKYPDGIPLGYYPEFPFTPEEYKKKWETGPFRELTGLERFIRIQGSYDLSVEDLIGDIDPTKALKYGITSPQSFIPGKVFKAHKGVLFFDEINRAPPKVQNALLQLLEEKKVSIGPYEFEIPIDIIVIATMNPEDYYGTEKLSDVLLDRFDIIFIDYPSPEEEEEILYIKAKSFLKVEKDLIKFLIGFINELRKDDKLIKKPSVRATIGIYEKAQALALLDNSDKVTLNHIYEAILSVLPHRIRLKPSLRLELSEEEYLEKMWEIYTKSKPNYLRRSSK